MSMYGSSGGMPALLPRRLIRRVERYPMPDGTVREKRYIQLTFQAPDGTIQTEECVEVYPPLDDGVVPEDMKDVLYCHLCKRLVCRSIHSFICHGCGLSFCVVCRVRVPIEGGEVLLCHPCAESATGSKFLKTVCKMIWGD